MNEWVVSSLVTVGLIVIFAIVLYLKENHQHILIGIIIGILAIIIFIGVTNLVHSFIYELLPSLRGGGQ